jgi:hypothetical protein
MPLRRTTSRFGLAFLAAATLAACPRPLQSEPACFATRPGALDAGPRFHPLLAVMARGTQNYSCRFADGGTSAAAWSAPVPDATLYPCGSDGGPVGTHFAGPSWQWAADRSSFVGDKRRAIAVPAPENPSTSIPWLLVPRQGGKDAGVLGEAELVERLDTTGGVVTLQDAGCTPAAADAGLVVKVPYSARYLFFQSN